MKSSTIVAALLLSFGASAAMAQTTATTVQRDVNQQTRIESGLKSGQLSTGEAAKLEKEESHVDRLQTQALKDGKMTPEEQARLKAAQDKTSADIAAAKHNNVTGNPNSASSKRMQADVQRNVNQQQRIENGVKSGELTNRETAKLEHGQAKVDRREARAGADGHVGAAEQARVQRGENRQSRRIFKQKHDAQVKG